MCWGFDISDHWFQPIYKLSGTLEKQIVALKPEDGWSCAFCGKIEKKHNWRRDLLIRIVQFFQLLIFWKKFWGPIVCVGYEPRWPKASQVKEKFASLRFYMTCETPEMSEAIRQAEVECSTICEYCGESGRHRYGGWERTLCDPCALKEGYADDDVDEEDV